MRDYGDAPPCGVVRRTRQRLQSSFVPQRRLRWTVRAACFRWKGGCPANHRSCLRRRLPCQNPKRRMMRQPRAVLKRGWQTMLRRHHLTPMAGGSEHSFGTNVALSVTIPKQIKCVVVLHQCLPRPSLTERGMETGKLIRTRDIAGGDQLRYAAGAMLGLCVRLSRREPL